MTEKDWVTLNDHVENLLLIGKRRESPEFEFLFFFYGRERITTMAKSMLKRLKAEGRLNCALQGRPNIQYLSLT